MPVSADKPPNDNPGKQPPTTERRTFGIARKSTAAQSTQHSTPTSAPSQTPTPTSTTTTRRQQALANSREKTHALRQLETAKAQFLGNFDPDRSARERRKINRKINNQQGIKRPAGALYDEFGVHIASGIDLCDCLYLNCQGCFFPCPKCWNTKCGLECRVNRKFMYDQIDLNGSEQVVRNPLLKY